MTSLNKQNEQAMKQCNRRWVSTVASMFASAVLAAPCSPVFGQTFGQPMFAQPGPYPQVQGQPVNGGYAGTTNNNQPYIPPTYNNQPLPLPSSLQTAPPLKEPWQLGTTSPFLDSSPFGYNPKIRDTPVDVYVQEGQTGRFSVGGSVNSDLGVAGNFGL